MSFNIRCKFLTNRQPVRKKTTNGFTSTSIRHFCEAQLDEFDNLLEINKCPKGCRYFKVNN